jgi:hypothetical protein
MPQLLTDILNDGFVGLQGTQGTQGITGVAATDALNILDDISVGFDGVTAQFSITVNAVPYTPALERLIVSVGGIIQEPDAGGTRGFRVSGSSIIFAEPPKSGQTFFAYYIRSTTSAEQSGASTEFSTALSVVFGL